MKFTVPIFIILLLISCADKTNSSKKQEQDFYPTNTKDLDDSTQILDLEYIAWACECANWMTPADINRYQDTGKLSDHSIFIEPADSALELPDTLGYSADIIRFSGKFYKEKGYPKNYLRTEQQVEKSRVFRYTKYNVIRSNYRDFVSDTIKKAK